MKKLTPALVATLAFALLTTACTATEENPGTAEPDSSATASTDAAPGPTETADTGDTAIGDTDPQTGYAVDGTFTIAITGDPGTLNPLNNASTFGNWLNRFLYDPLVSRGPDGEIVSGLADEWTFEGTKATFHIDPAATCSDGSQVTPSVIGKNFEYMLNPDNPSTNIGSVLPNRNYTYEADDAAGTFAIELDTPFSLFPSALSFLFVVCGEGADDPEALTTTSSGSGPFVLTEAVPNSQYTMTRRDGYAWGAGGATTAEEGTPATVVLQIVENETTAANLLAAGEINAAVVNGQDRSRLEAQGLAQRTFVSGGVVQSYNQSEGRVTADKA
ncbi:MAG: ABC transporter substrate-binding protein, partial [Bifidobacteriaceae bacterium]|nr:ABC transporter substrate-binding protein [Bifidobacteriaceae bacterium]